MSVFLSWSGTGSRSQAVAELLNKWLPCVIQALDPWISTQHIDQGALWFDEVKSQLSETTTGILCLTRANQDRPWLLFEAGALAKGLDKSRVCVLLIDLESSEVTGPLSFFHHTSPTKESMCSLVKTLNRNIKDNTLKADVLENVFDMYWPQFHTQFTEILSQYPENIKEKEIPESDILKEILLTTRNLARRIEKIEKPFDVTPPTVVSKSWGDKSDESNTEISVENTIKNLKHAGFDREFIKQILVDGGVGAFVVNKCLNKFSW